MYYLFKSKFIFGLIELCIELIVILIVLVPLFNLLIGSSSNETGEIKSITESVASYSWEDKLGYHHEQFDVSDLGEDRSIAQVGDKLKLNVETYGLMDKLQFALNSNRGTLDSVEKQKVKVVGLDLWFFQRWFR